MGIIYVIRQMWEDKGSIHRIAFWQLDDSANIPIVFIDLHNCKQQSKDRRSIIPPVSSKCLEAGDVIRIHGANATFRRGETTLYQVGDDLFNHIIRGGGTGGDADIAISHILEPLR